MKFSLHIRDRLTASPDEGLLDALIQQSAVPTLPRQSSAKYRCRHLPMMMSRRLSAGSRMAVDTGLELMQRHAVDALVFSSRHGELEKNYRIQQALHAQEELSPTVFAMSVHNAAVGTLSIAAGADLPSTAIAAGIDSFQQALIECYLLLSDGHQRVLLVDHDSLLPDFYLAHLPDDLPRYPYAVGLVLEAGDSLNCESRPKGPPQHGHLPQSIFFLHCLARQLPDFTLDGEHCRWHWTTTDRHA